MTLLVSDISATSLKRYSMNDTPFKVGKTLRAQTQVALGLRLAQTLPLLPRTSGESAGSEISALALDCRNEIIWSLLLLDRIFLGCTVPTPTLPVSAFGDSFVHSRCEPSGGVSDARDPYTVEGYFETGQGYKMADIVSTNIELFQILEEVIADNAQDLLPEAKPFWMGDSRRGQILSRLLELETSERTMSHLQCLY